MMLVLYAHQRSGMDGTVQRVCDHHPDRLPIVEDVVFL